MTRWEYKVVTWTSNAWGTTGTWSDTPLPEGASSEDMLNHMGEQGWEFVAIGPALTSSSTFAATAVGYIFKRPVT